MACLTHHHPKTLGECIFCHRDICPECLQEFGYYCSEKCRQNAKTKTDPLLNPQEKQELLNSDRRANRFAVIFVGIIPSIILGILAFIIISKIFDHSGKVRWEITLNESPFFLKSYDPNLYALFPSNQVKAYQIKDGKVRWEFQSPSHLPLFSFLEIQNEVVIFADKKNLYGLDIHTGKPVLHFQIPENMPQAPLRIQSSLWLLSKIPISQQSESGITIQPISYQLIKLNLSSFLQEKIILLSLKTPTQIVFLEGILFVVDHENFRKINIEAIDSKTGVRLWQKAFALGAHTSTEPLIQSHGILFFEKRKLFFLNLQGEVCWKRSLDRIPDQLEFTSEGNPLILSGSMLSCYQKTNGKRLWKRAIGIPREKLEIGSKIIYALGSFKIKKKLSPSLKQMLCLMQSPMLANTENSSWIDRLHGISSLDGKIQWQKDFCSGKPLFKNNHLYLLENRPTMNLLDMGTLGEAMRLQYLKPRSGQLRWKYSQAGRCDAIEISNHRIFFGKTMSTFSFGDLMRGSSSQKSDARLVCLDD